MTEGPQVDPDAVERLAAAGVTPAFANRVYVQVNDDVTRLAFAELVYGQMRYHTAIVMPTQDAIALATLVLRLHQQHETDKLKVDANDTDPVRKSDAGD